MLPFRVEAYLSTMVMLDPLFTVSLDGLLASQLHRQHLIADENMAEFMPLGRCVAEENWHWACSIARLHNVVSPGQDAIYSFYDETRGRFVSVKEPASIPATQGRFRHRRTFLFPTLCEKLVWHGYGIVPQVEQLLSDIPAVGGRRNIGYGTVLRWKVSIVEENPANWNWWVHHHDGGALGRPLPSWCVEENGWTWEHTVQGGCVPPVFNPENRTLLHY